MSSKKYGRNFLKGIASYRVPQEVTSCFVEKYLVALDCPRALTVLILWKNSEFEQIAKLEFNPLDYLTVTEVRGAYAATKFLSKYKDFSLPYDLKQVAVKKFEEFELLCRQTNSRFRRPQSDPLYRDQIVWLHHAIRRKICDVLGEISFDEFFSRADWGPGATTLMKRRQASSSNKFQREVGITRDLHALIPIDVLKGQYPLWASHLSDIGFPNFQVGNKVVTVPKDATTDRVIAIEPGINLWFQLSIGRQIGDRLRRVGIDLRDQSHNQRLARLGSIDSSLTTVDLSSASDSISVEVVRELLPADWFHLLDRCRSHYGTLEGKLVKWEKFSSMGNGFTFPLESLIFWAVARCTADFICGKRSTVSVYGDDVILPTSSFKLFSELMLFYGFRINLRKSHSVSLFRESCGSHYFSGVDIKPFYLKDRISSLPAVFRAANGTRRISFRFASQLACCSSFRAPFDYLVRKVPWALRLRIPDSLGDGGFISNFDEASPSRARHGIEGYHVLNLVAVSKTYVDDGIGVLLSRLWSMSPQPERAEGHPRLNSLSDFNFLKSRSLGNLVPLSGVQRIRLAKSLVSQWCDLGPWI